jgi:UPF0716 protein FxsA
MVFLFGFFALMVLEIIIFIAAGSALGFFGTIGLYVGAALLGGFIVQAQGIITMHKAKEAMDAGILPMDNMFDALCLMMAGLLLILPGFVSDIFALALVLPPVRALIRSVLSKKYGLKEGGLNPDNGVIDGEYVRIVEEDGRLHPPTH